MSHPSCKCHKVHICAWYVLSLSTLIIFSFSLKWYSVVKKTTVQLILFTKKATSINYSNSDFFKQPYCNCLALSHSTYKYSCEEVRRNPLLMPCFIVIRALLTSRCPIVISLSVRPCICIHIPCLDRNFSLFKISESYCVDVCRMARECVAYYSSEIEEICTYIAYTMLAIETM